jgi:hypothetical protein
MARARRRQQWELMAHLSRLKGINVTADDFDPEKSRTVCRIGQLAM